MKKLRLKVLSLGAREILSREQLKMVTGGCTSHGDCTESGARCENGACVLPGGGGSGSDSGGGGTNTPPYCSSGYYDCYGVCILIGYPC